MNWKSIILSFVITVATSCLAIAGTTDSTVYVAREHGGHGSGVLVAPDKVLTAAHILTAGRNEDKFSIITIKGDIISVKSWELLGNDIAVLTLDKAASLTPAEISCRPLEVRELLWGVGHPYGMFFVTVPLFVSAFVEDAPMYDTQSKDKQLPTNVHEAVMVSGPLLLGQSGGPVFDKDEKLVGLQNMQFLGNKQELTGIGAIIPATVFPQCKQ